MQAANNSVQWPQIGSLHTMQGTTNKSSQHTNAQQSVWGGDEKKLFSQQKGKSVSTNNRERERERIVKRIETKGGRVSKLR